jgi:hypothetical protein
MDLRIEVFSCSLSPIDAERSITRGIYRQQPQCYWSACFSTDLGCTGLTLTIAASPGRKRSTCPLAGSVRKNGLLSIALYVCPANFVGVGDLCPSDSSKPSPLQARRNRLWACTRCHLLLPQARRKRSADLIN